MKPELNLLVWATALAIVQVLIAVGGAFMQVGLMKLVGNREDMPKLVGWAGRAERAHLNILQSLVLFAVLVVVAVLTNRTNDMTLLGAQLFFWGRVAYALIYLAGIQWLRTLSWLVSIVGLVLIFLQLVK
ncbi:MAG TPA: MAPEG family protein [Burkholderiales bacterium]|nr:MAPEG family protein [Burkholderiales bacterium]